VLELVKIPWKHVMMDTGVENAPPTYYMLLSLSWGATSMGNIQLDLSYSMVPIFEGRTYRLYREPKMTYTLSDYTNPTNYPSYIADKWVNMSLI
jgi:hypothetical protein